MKISRMPKEAAVLLLGTGGMIKAHSSGATYFYDKNIKA